LFNVKTKELFNIQIKCIKYYIIYRNLVKIVCKSTLPYEKFLKAIGTLFQAITTLNLIEFNK